MRIALVMLATVISVEPLSAHDISKSSDQTHQINEAFSAARMEELKRDQPDLEMRYVYSRLLLWRPGQILKGCFLNGSGSEKEFVVKGTKELIGLLKANINIEFGEAPYKNCADLSREGDVRVSFEHGCCAAYIGRIAHDVRLSNQPTIMIQGIGSLGSSSRQILFHEILHTLGMEHEHQAPDAPCVFNKDAIKARTGWNDQDYSRNIERFDKDHRSYVWSSYDNKSIMKYYYYPQELEGGESSSCYSSENRVPSQRDIKGVQAAYPGGAALVSVNRTREIVSNIAISSKSKSIRDLAKQLEKLDNE